jgi:hypothetical protein
MDWNIVASSVVGLLVGILGSVIATVLLERKKIEKGARNIIIVLSILTGIAILISGLISARKEEQSKTPTFSEEVGHFEKSKALWEFVTEHNGGFIYLDIYMDALAVQASFDPQFPGFLLWVDCPLLKPGEELSDLNCSEGNRYVFSEHPGNKYIFEPNRNVYRIKGYFFVDDFIGPNLGVMSVRLRPALAEDVPLK